MSPLLIGGGDLQSYKREDSLTLGWERKFQLARVRRVKRYEQPINVVQVPGSGFNAWSR